MTDPRTRRRAARVVVVSHDDRVLLLRGGDPRRPEAGTWWFTPGGGLEPGESSSDAARRELAEETGLVVADVGPVVMTRVADFEFDGVHYAQTEDYFLVRGPGFALDTSRWSDVERSSIVEWRWWSVDELRRTTDTVYPPRLADLVDGRNAGGDDARGIARIAVLLIAAWSLVVLFAGVVDFISRTAQARQESSPDVTRWGNPIPLWLGIAIFVVWVLSLNLGAGGVAMGVVAVIRRRSGWWWRTAALLVVTVGGCVLEFVGYDWSTNDHRAFHTQRWGPVVSSVTAVVVVLVAWLLLRRPAARAVRSD